MPPVTLDCISEELTAFLPGHPESFASPSFLHEGSPEQLRGKVLQFDLLEPSAVELLILDQKR